MATRKMEEEKKTHVEMDEPSINWPSWKGVGDWKEMTKTERKKMTEEINIYTTTRLSYLVLQLNNIWIFKFM